MWQFNEEFQRRLDEALEPELERWLDEMMVDNFEAAGEDIGEDIGGRVGRFLGKTVIALDKLVYAAEAAVEKYGPVVEEKVTEYSQVVKEGATRVFDRATDYVFREVIDYQGNPDTADRNFKLTAAATAGTMFAPFTGIMAFPLILGGLGYSSVKAYQASKDFAEQERREEYMADIQDTLDGI